LFSEGLFSKVPWRRQNHIFSCEHLRTVEFNWATAGADCGFSYCISLLVSLLLSPDSVLLVCSLKDPSRNSQR